MKKLILLLLLFVAYASSYAQMSISGKAVQPKCYDCNEGAIKIIATGIDQPVTYNLLTTSGEIGEWLDIGYWDNLPNGSYIMVVKEADGTQNPYPEIIIHNPDGSLKGSAPVPISHINKGANFNYRFPDYYNGWKFKDLTVSVIKEMTGNGLKTTAWIYLNYNPYGFNIVFGDKAIIDSKKAYYIQRVI